jgi:hypothetical protein
MSDETRSEEETTTAPAEESAAPEEDAAPEGSEETADETVKFTLTEEDLAEQPVLAEYGFEAGDEIEATQVPEEEAQALLARRNDSSEEVAGPTPPENEEGAGDEEVAAGEDNRPEATSLEEARDTENFKTSPGNPYAPHPVEEPQAAPAEEDEEA